MLASVGFNKQLELVQDMLGNQISEEIFSCSRFIVGDQYQTVFLRYFQAIRYVTVWNPHMSSRL